MYKILITILILIFSFTLSFSQNTINIFVSPNGSDNASGLSPNLNGSDGPFKTIQKAVNYVYDLRKTDRNSKIVINLREGNHFISKPIILDKNFTSSKSAPVIFTAYKNEKPVISGGRHLDGWQDINIFGNKVWFTYIDDIKKKNWSFTQMWYNDKRIIPAREPNNGYFKVVRSEDAVDKKNWLTGQKNFYFKSGDLRGWATATNGRIVMMNRWVDSHVPISFIDASRNYCAMTMRTIFIIEPDDQYYIENVLEVLDREGEFYLDAKEGKLYVFPFVGRDKSSFNPIAPVQQNLFLIYGDGEDGRYENHIVENIIFDGVTFSHTEWKIEWLTKERPGSMQAAVEVDGAVKLRNARNIKFENCTFSHTGNYAIEFLRGSKDCEINRCEFFDLGAGGIKIGEMEKQKSKFDEVEGMKITNNNIHDGGRLYHCAIGIFNLQSHDNIIYNNNVYNFYYTGLSIGWSWGFDETQTYNIKIENNHVHHIGKLSTGDGPILSDMGIIYTLGVQPGTVIRNNLFHDVSGYHYGGWGIYLDEGSSNILVENNIVYNTRQGGFHQHYGKDNLIKNNIFAFSQYHQILLSRAEEYHFYDFYNNIVLLNGDPVFGGTDPKRFNFNFDNNIYWDVNGKELTFGGMDWNEWRSLGKDKNSMITDPKFVDPLNYNFNLKSDSPALKLGFKPISTSNIGPK